MAKNDYFVLLCRLLAYLYNCLKKDIRPSWEYMTYDTRQFPISEDYFVYLIEQAHKEGYIEGILLFPENGFAGIKDAPQVRITPKGIEFLQENTNMKKALRFLKTLKESVPGIK